MAQDWARPVVHWEIEAVDPERQRVFYADLFNWQIGDGFIMEIPPGIGGPEPGPTCRSRPATGAAQPTRRDTGSSLFIGNNPSPCSILRVQKGLPVNFDRQNRRESSLPKSP